MSGGIFDSEDEGSLASKNQSKLESDDNSLGCYLEFEKADLEAYAEKAGPDDEDEIGWKHFLEVVEETGSLLIINGTPYIYINEVLGWTPATSIAAAKYICGVMKLNAPVNMVTAAAPITNVLLVYRGIQVSLPHTFTQGSIRYQFSYKVDDRGYHVMEMQPVIPDNYSELLAQGIKCAPDCKGTFCYSPTNVRQPYTKIGLPPKINFSKMGILVNRIYEVFGEQTLTILWIIGDILADFGDKRMFILYGPGDIGKTTILNMIIELTSPRACKLAARYFYLKPNQAVNFGNSINKDDRAQAANCRSVVLGDVETRGENVEVNMQNVKELTGGDANEFSRVSNTILMGTNELYFYKYMNEWTQVHNTRRVVVVPTLPIRKTPNKVFGVPSDEDTSMLAAYGMIIRCMYTLPPLTTMSLLMTLFMAKFPSALYLINIDEESTIMENYIATKVLCKRFSISEYNIQHCLKSVGSNCVKLFCNSVYVIANISLKHDRKFYSEKTRAQVTREKNSKGNYSTYDSKKEFTPDLPFS